MEKKREKLQTQQLVLKPFEECDRQPMVEILFDKEIKKTYMLPDFTERKQAEPLFERLMASSKSDERFLYGIYFEGAPVGFVNDCEIKDDAIEIGYVITPAHQGKGFATEAVKACIEELFRMGFAHIRAGFFEGNVASCRVMEKCGMHRIELEEDIEYKGVLHHCLYYEIHKTGV